MKKAVGIAAGVVIVLAAGWLGATWYTGKRIEADAPARLEEVNQKLADVLSGMGFGVTIKQISYERHFFAHQVRYDASLANGHQNPEAPQPGTASSVSSSHQRPFPKHAIPRRTPWPSLASIYTPPPP